MSIKETIDNDIKTAMLAGQKTLVTTLRGLKSAILYAEVASASRDKGLSDEEVIVLFTKEAKKRQESADLYSQGGNKEKADAEIVEKTVIEGYLPKQISDDELRTIVLDVVGGAGGASKETMGQLIAQVKNRVGATADGSRVASLVKEQIKE